MCLLFIGCTHHLASSQLFLDNERGNCVDVASIGVTVAYVPDGVTADAWERALKLFPAPGEILQ